MTHASQLSPEDLAQRRSKVASRAAYGGKIVMAHTCPTTRGGVVVAQSPYAKDSLVAYLFRPTQINRYYATHNVDSAHQALGMLRKIGEDMEAKKLAKKAPHSLKVGDIMVETMGATMMRAHFYQVVAIPHPRKVEVAALDLVYESGDWMAGSVVPALPPEGTLSNGSRRTYPISMEHGEPESRVNSITRLRVWNKKPVHVYSD